MNPREVELFDARLRRIEEVLGVLLSAQASEAQVPQRGMGSQPAGYELQPIIPMVPLGKAYTAAKALLDSSEWDSKPKD